VSKESRQYLRFGISYRVEHLLLILSFGILAVTGLAQKFSTVGVSLWFMGVLGGVETVRIVHRVAAGIMGLETVYHLGVVGYRLFVRRSRLTMMPGLEDGRAALQAVLHNLGLSRSRPMEGRYTFAEKAEYWALIWGTVIMGITGFVLWNPIATARILPGEFIPAAKAAHGGEAVLAVLAILVWHFYHVHVKMFNKSAFTGSLTEKEMAHEHPLELADIVAGTAERRVDPQGVARRQRVFIPIYGVLTIVMVAGLAYFLTFEETALATVSPMEDVEAYVPLTPTPFPTPLPTSTPLPVESLSWTGGVASLFQNACGACHSSANPMGGLDAGSYAGVLAGIVPPDPDAGAIVAVQVAGGHAGQFNGDELVMIRRWIEAGAPEE
jgi:cytochrome b subunit of formate dehydrogenase